MAEREKAELTVLYVERVARENLPAEASMTLEHNLKVAESLGARVITLPGEDLASTVAFYARMEKVTRIVLGKPLALNWADLFRGSVVDRLVRKTDRVEVVVLNSQSEDVFIPGKPLRRDKWKGKLFPYLGSLGLVGLATVVGIPLSRFIFPTNLVMIYLAAVLGAALLFGKGPSVLASVTGVLAFNFFMVPPYYTLLVADSQYVLTFIGLLLVGLVVSELVSKVREQALVARNRAAQTVALYGFSQDLSATPVKAAVLHALAVHARKSLGRETAVFFPDEKGGPLHLAMATEDFPLSFGDDLPRAAEIMTRASEGGNGRGSDSEEVFFPIPGHQGPLGVAAFRKPSGESSGWRLEDIGLREAFLLQTAQALERADLAEKARRSEILQVREKILSAVLNSISHEIRTPLSTITGVLSSLRMPDVDDLFPDPEARRSLVETAWSEALRMNRLISNLLGMSRLEAGAMKLEMDLTDISEVIEDALAYFRPRGEDVRFEVELPDELTLVRVDFGLLSLTLSNLLDNALKYSPPESPIVVRVTAQPGAIRVSVLDRGPGIPEEFREKVFEKFFRMQETPESGTGLGLAICKGIIEAHGGHVEVFSREGGGTVMSLVLPRGGSEDGKH